MRKNIRGRLILIISLQHQPLWEMSIFFPDLTWRVKFNFNFIIDYSAISCLCQSGLFLLRTFCSYWFQSLHKSFLHHQPWFFILLEVRFIFYEHHSIHFLFKAPVYAQALACTGGSFPVLLCSVFSWIYYIVNRHLPMV